MKNHSLKCVVTRTVLLWCAIICSMASSRALWQCAQGIMLSPLSMRTIDAFPESCCLQYLTKKAPPTFSQQETLDQHWKLILTQQSTIPIIYETAVRLFLSCTASFHLRSFVWLQFSLNCPLDEQEFSQCAAGASTDSNLH